MTLIYFVDGTRRNWLDLAMISIIISQLLIQASIKRIISSSLTFFIVSFSFILSSHFWKVDAGFAVSKHSVRIITPIQPIPFIDRYVHRHHARTKQLPLFGIFNTKKKDTFSSTVIIGTKDNNKIRSTARIASIDECIGSGSYGTVHKITVQSIEEDNENNTTKKVVVGKRAWTIQELQERNKDNISTKTDSKNKIDLSISKEQQKQQQAKVFPSISSTPTLLKEKADRCIEYFKIEEFCFQKFSTINTQEHNISIHLPKYLGTLRDEQNRFWMLFETITSTTPVNNVLKTDTDTSQQQSNVLSLADYMEKDRMDHKLHNEHHLFYTSQALWSERMKQRQQQLLIDPKQQHEQTSSPLSLGETLDSILSQLLNAITIVHSQQIVHRDIKPSNLLIDGDGNLILIDFGSAADLSTSGLFKENVGIKDMNRVAISPIYTAPELFIDPSDIDTALKFDVFSIALLYCQLLFQYLDERTDSGFHQQLEIVNYDLDLWLQSILSSKVRPAMLDDALDTLEERPGLWKLLQEMLIADPKNRLSSIQAQKRWNTILINSKQLQKKQKGEDITTDEENSIISMFVDDVVNIPLELNDGPFLREVLQSRQTCFLEPLELQQVPTIIRPLHYVASFSRSQSLGLVLAEYDSLELDNDDNEDISEEIIQAWKIATQDAAPGEVFVRQIIPGGQADQMGIFHIGDRLQGVGELPLNNGGFERAVELIQDQPRGSKYVTLHFDRKLVSTSNASPDDSKTSSTILPAYRSMIDVIDQGAWLTRGKRKTQEDAFILNEIHGMKDQTFILAGIFDGHLGSEASTFVQDQLPSSFRDEVARMKEYTDRNPSDLKSTSAKVTKMGESAINVGDLLQKSWETVCEMYRETCSLESSTCVAEYDPREGRLMAFTGSMDSVAGTTATVFVVHKQTGHVATLNCGDSRGIIITSAGKVYFQTVDHKPENEYERFLQGQQQGLDYSLPQCKVNTWRVAVGDYDYAVARSLEGPFATSKGIISIPDLSLIQISDQGMMMLIASDGFWEVIDSEEAAQIVARLKNMNKMNASDVAKKLCSLAIEKGSSDNVSTVLLYLG